jgi:hypothetical protein
MSSIVEVLALRYRRELGRYRRNSGLAPKFDRSKMTQSGRPPIWPVAERPFTPADELPPIRYPWSRKSQGWRSHAATRFHHASRRRGGAVATCGSGVQAAVPVVRFLAENVPTNSRTVCLAFGRASWRPVMSKVTMWQSNIVGLRATMIDCLSWRRALFVAT